MRTMNCQTVRQAIEASDRGDSLSVAAAAHVRVCAACEMLNDDHLKLRNMTANLGTIEAPADFDFRLRARLARANAQDARPAFGRLTFGFRSVALASLMVVFGGAMLVAYLRTTPQQPVAEPTINTPIAAATPFQQPTGAPGAATNPVAIVKPAVRPSEGKRVKTGTRDMASGRAPVVRPGELTARASDFSIDASPQPVKVSLDDGRGTRTISLPAVSFGSQRVVSQSNSPLVASARGAW